MLREISSPPQPLPDSLWYYAQKNWNAGGYYADLFSEAPVRTPQAVAAISIGLVGFGLAACHRGTVSLRPVEPRLTGVLTYTPCRPASEASGLIPNALCEGKPRRPSKRKSAEADGEPVRGEAPPETSAGDPQEALGDLLSDSDVRRLSWTIRKLESRSVDEPGDARNWSDLSAAYLVRAQRSEDPRDLLRAYEASDRAVREDGSLPEARFNRALSLQRLFLYPEARAAWRDYRKLDATSGWADEALSHLRELEQPTAWTQWDVQRQELERAAREGMSEEVEAIVSENRQAAREYAEKELFGLWADAVVAGRSDLAEERLRLLRSLGDALVKVDGEHLVRDSVKVIDDSLSEGDPSRWRDLAEAHRTFRDGCAAYYGRKEGAVAKLSAARDALTRLGSPLALRAEFFLVCCDYLGDQYPRGLAGIERLAGKVKALGYGALRGHVFQVKAVLEDALGRTQDAIQDYGKMRGEFQRLGERENAANAGCLLAQPLRLLGRRQEAWRFLYQSLKTLPALRNPATRANLLRTASDAALRDGEDAAALAFEQARARVARRADPLAAVEALTWLARLQEHMGEREPARATLAEAKARAERLEGSRVRRKRADLAMIEGEMRAKDDPRQAVDLLTSALAVYREDKNFLFSLQTLFARGRAHRQMGDDLAAERDLGEALAFYDRLGEDLVQEDLRLTYLEETDEVFDEMVSLQAERDPDLALAYADRARTRVLPGSVSELWAHGAADPGGLLAAEPQPLPLSEIRRRLPERVTLVQFFVLPDRVLIWNLRRDGKETGFFTRSIPRGELESLAGKLQDFASPRWEKAGSDLFDLLLRPWLAGVPDGERIVLIPDKVLHRVPFAALKDRSTGKFLVESHPLAIAPSATLYVHALERQGASRPIELSSGLVVGDPAADPALFADLPELRDSAAEAQHLAELTGSHLLTRESAGKTVFLAAAQEADWVHFSGHALVDARNPLLSKLVLAPEAQGEPGALTAKEIYALKLHKTRLVVLAACDTGEEYIPGSEGATSLARAFLAAGVPTVVASLWSVDDRATAKLFAGFHQLLVTGNDPVDALRKAQLQMLHAGDKTDRSPQAWAAFEVIGASAN